MEVALAFLKSARTGEIKNLENENIIVIGGGDVAMDCALTAHQLGANTKIVYRRSIEEAPANIYEISMIQAMGISMITEFTPVETIEEEGKLKKIKFESRDKISNMELKADRMIFAIGQKRAKDFKDFKVEDKVFASGDIANGGDTVVEAVAEGKEVAKEIMNYIDCKEDK